MEEREERRKMEGRAKRGEAGAKGNAVTDKEDKLDKEGLETTREWRREESGSRVTSGRVLATVRTRGGD